MVELFTVGRLIRSPRLSAPVWSVARLTAPHVSTVERTRHDSKPMSPRDGIRQSIATPASFRTAQSPRRRYRHRTTEHVRLARIQNEKNKSRFVPVARSVSDREFAHVGSQQSHHRTVASPYSLTLSSRQAKSGSSFLHSERWLESGQGLSALAIG